MNAKASHDQPPVSWISESLSVIFQKALLSLMLSSNADPTTWKDKGPPAGCSNPE
jgi:hypothetical protein